MQIAQGSHVDNAMFEKFLVSVAAKFSKFMKKLTYSGEFYGMQNIHQ